MKIPLLSRSGELLDFAHVDDDDYEDVSRYTWRRYENKRTMYTYAYRWVTDQTSGKRRQIALHQQVMQVSNVFHRNGNGLDCRRRNLVVATHAEIGWSRRGAQRNSQSGILNAYFSPSRGKWVAQVRRQGKKVYIGQFDSQEEAGAAAAHWRSIHTIRLTHRTDLPNLS